jgi:PEP-CTERM motif
VLPEGNAMRRPLLACLAALALLANGMSEPALADSVPVFTISDTFGDPHADGSAFTLGWSFHTNAQLTVDMLGVFASDGGGLLFSHQVAIFQGNNVVAMVTVDSGTTDTLINQFRYKPLATPVTLANNTDYTIGALYTQENGADDDYRVTNAHNFMPIGQITYGRPLYAAGDTLQPPDQFQNTAPGFFGPIFTVTGIPEPSSLTLICIAVLGMGSYAWRRRKPSVCAVAFASSEPFDPGGV